MILFDYIINNINLELNNFEENISEIESGGVIISVLEIKYCWGIKENNIKIYILPLI